MVGTADAAEGVGARLLQVQHRQPLQRAFKEYPPKSLPQARPAPQDHAPLPPAKTG